MAKETGMRQLGWFILALWIPTAGIAQDALIRIEAKRGEQAVAEAVARWQGQFGNVVFFPLNSGWTAIALGPLNPADAEQRLKQLKSAGQIPADSFVTIPATSVTVTAADSSESAALAAPTQITAEPVIAPASKQHFIRVQAFPDRTKAELALADWRKSFPEAGLWETPKGWFAIAIGPFDDTTSQAWTERLKGSGALPKDAFTSEQSKLGIALSAGKAPNWGKAGTPQPMPPMEKVQEALAWAGHYTGEIDGKAGPQTRAAIDAEILEHKASPDPATAMHALFDRREAWRNSFGLSTLEDRHTELQLTAPLERLQFDRTERALSIYGPRNNSGAALILFGQSGGQQELLDLSGLVTALGWVPSPERLIERNHIRLTGQNDDFIGYAEGWVRGGRVEGFVLVWPVNDQKNQTRLVSEMRRSLQHLPPTPAVDSAEPAESSATLTLPEASSTAPETRQKQDQN